MRYRHSILAASITTVLLTACGGGGGGSNVRPPIVDPPPPATCQDQTARNFGQPGACIPRYRGARDNTLVSTNVDRVHAQGLTGEGVKIGLLDGGPRPDLQGFSTYEGRYTFHGADFMSADRRDDPDTSHGHRMAQHIVGRPSGDFDGGVAPGATLEWLRFCAEFPGTDPASGGLCGGNFTAAYDFLFNRGVTIVNQSFGGQTRFWEASAADQELFRSIGSTAAQAVQRDMLLVWAGGNRPEASISYDAGMPYFFPEYRNNWLAVIGVDIGADGRPGAATGAQCVVAAQWCIAAPTLNSNAVNNSTGSSSAAAVVSGVAALVSQAFPWMGGRNLQATLLTTATDMGAAGVDEVFGWGFVNAERAVRGPAQFTTDFGANVDRAGTWTFANDISGSGGLIKDGVGNLRLSGTNTYGGLTDVRGGNLVLSGSIAGGVRNASTFTSEGGRIGGNYQALASSTTQVVVGRGLEVTGSASLAGTLNLLAPTDPQYQVREAERVLRAGSISGTFGNVTVGSDFFYTATLAYNPTDVIANLARRSAAAKAVELGAGASVVAGASRMDGLLDYLWDGNGNADIRAAAFGIASAADAESAMGSLTSLVGEVHGTVRAMAIEQAQGDAAVLADRAFGLRRSGDGAAAWAQIVGRDGTLKSSGFADADLSSTGLLVGADMAISDSLRIGGALTSTRGSGSLEGLAGNLDTDRAGVGLYALAQGHRAYASVTVGFDRLDVETEREIDLGTAGFGLVTADRKDRVQHARIEAGYELAGVVPYAAVGGLRHRQGGFTEAGANATVGSIGLTANADSHTVSYAEAGIRVDRATQAGGAWGGLLAGRWTLSGEDVGYLAAFTGATPVSFDAEGQQLAGSVIRVGLNYMSPDYNGWRWFAEGVAEGNSGSVRDGRLGLGVRYSF